MIIYSIKVTFRIFAITLLLATCKTFNLQAQSPPGYQGKRLILNYDFSFFPALSNPNMNGYNGPVSYNAKNSIGAEYIISRQSAVGLSSGFFKTQADWNGSTTYKITYANGDTREEFFSPDGNALIAANYLMIYFSYYVKTFLAPIGWYHRLGIGRLNYRVDLEDKESLKANPQIDFNYGASEVTEVSNTKIINHYRYGHTVLRYSFGKQKIIYDRVVLRYGMEVGWLSGSIMNLVNIGAGNLITVDNYIEVNTKNRLIFHNLLNLNLGIGFLAY